MILVADEVSAINLVPSATTDIEVTTPASTEPSVHTDEDFSEGPSDRSMLTEYADHVAYQLWQGNVLYILCLTLIYLLLFDAVLKVNC